MIRGAAYLMLAATVPLAAAARPCAAQGSGTTGFIILELPLSARAVGLGGAYAAVVGDEGSVFANPAGMATISRIAVGGSWERSLLGTSLTTGAFALRAGRFDVGAGVALLDYGGDPVVIPDPCDCDRGLETGGRLTAYQALAVGALAYRRGLLSVGGSVKALREHVAGGDIPAYTANGVTGDIGAAIAVFDLVALAVVVQNVAGRARAGDTRIALPRTTRVGFTFNFIDPQGTARLMTTTDYVAPPGGNAYWVMGLEAGAVASGIGIVGRVGFAMGRASSDKGLAYGGSLQVRSLRLDYGYQPYDALGAASQRFGVRWII